MNVLTDLDGQLVIAHRGNSAHAPENTLESFAQAVALGVDALELDVHVTRDGVPVVIHDPTLGRTTNRPEAVAEISAARLRCADAGANFSGDGGATFPYRGLGLTIPTLAEVLREFPGVPLLIEVKVAEAAQPIARALARAGATSSCVAAAMNAPAVAPLRGSDLATGASAGDVLRLLGDVIFRRRPAALPYSALCIPRFYSGVPLPVASLARLARGARAATHVWTVDDVAIAQRLWSDGIQGVVTNDPAPMLRARSALATAR
jgi:glycerophosphoryl diester phosphodiesterase